MAMHYYDSYYKKRLNAQMQKTYARILIGLQDFIPEINLDSSLSQSDVKSILKYVLLDNPRLFYVDSNFDIVLGISTQLLPKYTYSKRAIEKHNSTIDKYLQKMNKDFYEYKLDSAGDLEKEHFVHNHCLRHFSYDDKRREISHTILGPIINKKAVGYGISKFVKMALNYLGVNCLIVTGTWRSLSKGKAQPHAWNIVEVDGWSYHLDVTHDMTLSQKINRYDYFNIADSDILKDHVINDVVPICRRDGSYFQKKNLVAYSFGELESIVDRHVRQTNNVHFCVKLASIAYTDNTVNEIMKLGLKCYQAIHTGNAKVNVRYNAEQMVFEILIKK